MGPLSGNFDQKPWAIAHGFEDGGFGWVSEIVPNSIKDSQNASKSISNSIGDYSCWFGENYQGSDFGRFWPKTLGYI